MIFRAFFSGLDLKVHTHCMATSAKRETFFFQDSSFFGQLEIRTFTAHYGKSHKKLASLSRALRALQKCAVVRFKDKELVSNLFRKYHTIFLGADNSLNGFPNFQEKCIQISPIIFFDRNAFLQVLETITHVMLDVLCMMSILPS